MAKSPAWTRSEGKNPEGGLNEKGRASLRAAGHDIKRPQPEGGSRKDSFCARMKGMKAKLTSSETANDPDSRINKSLRKWKCADGGALDIARKYKAEGGVSIDDKAMLRQKLLERVLRKEKESKTPSSSQSMTTPYKPSPPTPAISKDQYMRGNLGRGDYALATGGSVGRKGYALGGNPVDQSNPYLGQVNSLYQNILGRQADVPGANYWANQLNTGATTLQDMLGNFAGSQEYQNLYKSDPTKAVSGMYQAALDRAPEQAGLQYWTGQAQQGLTPAQLAAQFSNAQEFQNRNAIFNSYLNYTGQAPSAEQYASASKLLSGGKNLGDVEQQISTSPQANMNFVKNAYQGLIGQIPDQSQIQSLTDKLSSGELTQQNLLNMLASSSQGGNYANEQLLNSTFRNAMGRSPTQAEQNYYLPQLAQNNISQSDLFNSVRNTPEATDYNNTRLVKDTFKALTGQVPSSDEINRYINQLATGEITSQQLWDKISATPQSQKWVANTPVGSFDSLVGNFAQGTDNLTGLGAKAAGKVQGLWDQITQINPELAGNLTALLGFESGAKGLTAEAGNSSAAGLGQQTTDYITQNINDLFGTNYSSSNLPSDIKKAITSTDPSSQAISLASFLQGTLSNVKALNDSGIPATAANTYFLHNLGKQGGLNFLSALERNPNLTAGAIASKVGGVKAITGNKQVWPQGLNTKLKDAFSNVSDKLDPNSEQGAIRQNWGTNVINQLHDISKEAIKPSTTTPPTPGGGGTPKVQGNLDDYNKAFTQYKRDLGMYWFEQQTLYNSGKSYAGNNISWPSWEAWAKQSEPKPPDPTKYGFSFNKDINNWTYSGPPSTGGNTGQGLAGQGAGGNVAGTGGGAFGGVQPLVIPGITGNADLAKSLENRSIEQQADYLAKGQALALGLAQQGQAVAEGAIAAGRTALQNYLTATGSQGLSYLMGFSSAPPTDRFGNTVLPPSGFGISYGGGGYGGTGSVTTAGGGGGTSVGSGGYGISFMNKGGAVKGAMDVARAYKKGGPVWDKPRPKSLGKPTPLSSDQKSSAKAMAKAAGRPYPNLVDNMRAAKKS